LKTSSLDITETGRGARGWTPDCCSGLAEVGGEALRPGGLELTGYLLKLADFADGSRILDAGCGLGATLGYLQQSGRFKAVGVDSSKAMLAAAGRNSGDFPLLCADLERLPFGAAGYDGVICECVLSQTSIPEVLAEFHRVLRPDGLLLVSDLYRRCAAGMPDEKRAKHDPPPGKDRMLALLTAAGFTLEIWEDRTRDLRQLAAQLIMAPGPTQSNLFGWSGGTGCMNEKGSWRDVGYHLLVARRSAP
jgi:arsenite methyltransferase